MLRTILKAADLCASDPTGAARRMVDGGFIARYDYALQTLKEIPYNKWREYDPADTKRLREASRIASDGTDWQFLNALKRELKG